MMSSIVDFQLFVAIAFAYFTVGTTIGMGMVTVIMKDLKREHGCLDSPVDPWVVLDILSDWALWWPVMLLTMLARDDEA